MDDSSLAPVLVAVDRGGSASAVRFGAAEALRTGRPLRLVHVAPANDGWLVQVGQDSLRMALARTDAEVAGRIPVHGTVTRGSVLVQLAGAAAGAALVVLEQLPPTAHRRPDRPRPQPWPPSSTHRWPWCRRAGSRGSAAS
jgi:hypothetical protein